MSSSTSSSDAPAWRRLALTLPVVAIAGFTGFSAFGIAIDPYDTGRFALTTVRGVPAKTPPHLANASRARDPAFDAAVIGNSHIQLVDPQALSRASGASFTSLATPGSVPREQALLLRFFLDHRQSPPKALVVGLDNTYCFPHVGEPPKYPFPTWLYGAGTIEYLRAMMGWNLVDTTEWRLRYMAGLEKRARPDGYVDYGPLLDAKPQSRRDQHKRVGDTPLNTTDSYPAIDLLRSLIARFPAEAKVVLVRPPVYVTALPAKGTPAEAAAETCRAKMRELAAERPNTALVDWHGYHRPESYDAEAFYDHTHYTNPVARALEADIAAAFERLPGGRR